MGPAPLLRHGSLGRPPVRPIASNWVTLHVAFFGEGSNADRFRGQAAMLDESASVLVRFVEDIDKLRAGDIDSLEFESSYFQCRIARIPSTQTSLSMLCRCASPNWWNASSPPSPGVEKWDQFAGTVNVLMPLDSESLEKAGGDIAKFLAWLERTAEV